MGASPCTNSLPNPPGGDSGAGESMELETRVVSNHPWLEGPPVSQTKLLIRVKIRLSDGTVRNMTALIDTGAEVNLIQRGLVDQKFFRPSLKKKVCDSQKKE